MSNILNKVMMPQLDEPLLIFNQQLLAKYRIMQVHQSSHLT